MFYIALFVSLSFLPNYSGILISHSAPSSYRVVTEFSHPYIHKTPKKLYVIFIFFCKKNKCDRIFIPSHLLSILSYPLSA